MYPVFVDELVETETELVVDNVRDVRAICSQQGGYIGYGKIPVGVHFFFIEKADQFVLHLFSFDPEIFQIFLGQGGENRG